MTRTLSFFATNETLTEYLATVLARHLPPGTVVALIGTLGAGKTRLVRGVAEALGVPVGEVTSPTFVLIREYAGTKPIYHFDTYRLTDEDEFDQLGPDEYFDSDGLSFVEWADRVAASLPPNRLEIRIEVVSPEERRFTLEAVGGFSTAVLADIATELDGR